MTENTKENISEKTQEKSQEIVPARKTGTVLRMFSCPVCKTVHKLNLEYSLTLDQPSFPFPYVYLHSSVDQLKDLLTTLYLDADLQIRGVEVIKLENSDIFSEELTLQITEKLTEEIFDLQTENLQLSEENERLQTLFEKLNLNEIKEVCVREEMIQVLFTSIIGSEEVEITIDIHPSRQIEEIKCAISKKFNLIPAMYHLSYEGLLLDYSKSIKDYDIIDGSNVIIIPNSNAG